MDPATILSVISSSLSITAFLVNNIPALISKGKDMKNSEHLLSIHVNLLRESLTTLEMWRRFWYGEIKPTDEHCRTIWGDQGWDDIKLRLGDILRLSRNIKEELTIEKLKAKPKVVRRARPQSRPRFGHAREQHLDRRDDPVRAWLGLEGEPGSDLEPRDVGFLKSIIFGLYGHPRLQGQIEYLRTLTRGLWSQAFELYAMQGHIDPGQSPTSATIDRHKKSLHIAGFLSELLRKCQSAPGTSEWNLELRLPEDLSDQSEYPSLEDLIEDLRVDFLVRFNTPNLGITAERRSIKLHETRPDGVVREWRDLQAADLVNTGHRINVSFDGVFYCIETVPGRLSDTIGLRDHILRVPLDDMYHLEWIQYVMDRASIALGATLWFVLLWPTNFFSHICSCRIARNTMKFERGSRNESIHVHAFRLWVSDVDNHMCHDRQLLNNSLLLLSTLHGELALADPLRLQAMNDGSVAFVAGSDMPRQFMYTLSQESFLQKIEEDASTNLAKAARFCMTSHLRKSGPPGRVELQHRVLHPVGKFYARRLQHYRPWQNRLVS